MGKNEGDNPELEDSGDEENTDESENELERTTSAPINSKALLARDMISDTDTVSVASAKPKTTRAPAPEKNISVAEAFENW